MSIFVIDGKDIHTYQFLLDNVNKKTTYAPEFQGKGLFSFFSNLITALAGDCPLTLVDSDFSIKELESFGLQSVNKEKQVVKPYFTDFDTLLDKLRNSTSTISIFTSGTTGQPKIVSHTYSTLSRAVRTGKNFQDNVWGFAYNPTHMAGLQVFFQAIENENAIINIFNCQRSKVYEAIDINGITHISATPTFYRLLLPFERRHESVVRVTIGGEKSEEKLYHSISKIFPNAKITNVYASTEAGTLFASKGSTFQIPSDMCDKFKVIDNELFIHTSLLGKSDKLTFEDDFYPSGDLIEWINPEERIFRFKSRKNELINVGGYKVNPQEVEEAIRMISGILDTRVFGKTNSVLGNVLCADVVKEPSARISEIEIRGILRSILQDFKIPRRIKFVESITVTRTGKMKR